MKKIRGQKVKELSKESDVKGFSWYECDYHESTILCGIDERENIYIELPKSEDGKEIIERHGRRYIKPALLRDILHAYYAIQEGLLQFHRGESVYKYYRDRWPQEVRNGDST